MITILMMILSSLFSLIIVEDFELTKKVKKYLKDNLSLVKLGLKKKIKIIDIPFYIIYKVISCSACFSYWLFSFSYLIMFGSGLGFLLGPFVYYLTKLLYKFLYTVKF